MTWGDRYTAEFAETPGLETDVGDALRRQRAREIAAEILAAANPKTTTAEQYEAALIRGDEIENIPPPERLLGEFLSLDSLAFLYGASGTYKTFLALSWALAVSTGTPWHGQKNVHQGRVLYIVAEGLTGIGQRIAAWKARNFSTPITDDLIWLPMAAQLFTPDLSDNPVVELAVKLDPVFVIVDTLARCTIGANESSNPDMSYVVGVLDQIRQRTGCCVMPIHHTGKDESAGLRGASAMYAAADVVIRTTGGSEQITLTIEKSKDAERDRTFSYGIEREGNSLVITDEVPRESPEGGLSESAIKALEALRFIDVEGGNSATTWLKTSHLPDTTFYRARSVLCSQGLVTNVGTDKQPKYRLTPTLPQDSQ
jgi:AAA domain